MSDHTVPSRFARSGSTVRFDHGGSPVAVTVCTSRIVRVELADERDAVGPSYVGPRSWAAVPFEIMDGEHVRLSTGDLHVEAATSPLRLTFLDTAGGGRLVWYFLIGQDLRSVMLEVAELLGRPPLPPRWAWGFSSPPATSR